MVKENCFELNFSINPPEPGREILIAELAEIGFESFQETDTGVRAFIHLQNFDTNRLKSLEILRNPDFNIGYTQKEWENENWNRVWEEGYDPVLVDGKVFVRASFHNSSPKAEFDLVIDPKMSFGTAHHETTSLMIGQMLNEPLMGKTVLDMGCGTAVLAILAEKMGAANILAIDNDRNAVENARENIRKNNCRNINVVWGDVSEVTGSFDVMMININKNTLIRDLQKYVAHLLNGGVILFSGFYVDDLEELRVHAHEIDLEFDYANVTNNWAMARFVNGQPLNS